MAMRQHYQEMTDDLLSALNMPNSREVNTMQQRLHQLRRDNLTLKKKMAAIELSLAELRKSKSHPHAKTYY